MMRIRTARHDAEWLLQHQLIMNEVEQNKQERAAARNERHIGKTTTAPIILHRVNSPTVFADARQVIAGQAVRAGASAAELAEVLDMLGLLPGSETVTTTYTDKGERRPKRGTCTACGRRSIKVRLDGCLISHTPKAGQPLNDETRCPGTGRKASAVEAATPLAESAKQSSPEPAQMPTTPRLRDTLPGTAACRTDPEAFFLPTYGDTYAAELAKARRICRRCPFTRACLAAALDLPGVDGIWAGTTPRQRKDLLAARAAAETGKSAA